MFQHRKQTVQTNYTYKLTLYLIYYVHSQIYDIKYPSSAILYIIALSYSSLITINYSILSISSIWKLICLIYLHDNTAILYIRLVLDWRVTVQV